MKTKKIEKFIDKFAKLYLQFQDKQVNLIKKLSNEDLEQLAAAFDKCALGGEKQTCFGFRVELWDRYANNVRKELWLRNMFKRANESGLACYCPTCDGKCLGEDHHDLIVPAKTEYEMRVGEMSRDQLTAEILKLNKLLNESTNAKSY